MLPEQWPTHIRTSKKDAAQFITRAKQAHARLTLHGLELPVDYECDFTAERARLDEAHLEVAMAADLLSLLPRTETTGRKYGSYGLKHTAEKLSDARGVHVYVSNGALIAAATGLNIAVTPIRTRESLCYLNVSQGFVKKLEAALDRFRLGWKDRPVIPAGVRCVHCARTWRNHADGERCLFGATIMTTPATILWSLIVAPDTVTSREREHLR